MVIEYVSKKSKNTFADLGLGEPFIFLRDAMQTPRGEICMKCNGFAVSLQTGMGIFPDENNVIDEYPVARVEAVMDVKEVEFPTEEEDVADDEVYTEEG